ncbi:peptidoglycan-binding domain-containing protein [Alkalilimnicola sp. S0819]|uniref:peptidoglycan-binding domain-containing protein n=1 Tax=Alkalilimnicola sp. S0819 TaxID=2613922 RepID=UPI0012628110|nr:peptidoglycan-binding domain-containing protein [Alkalilimnicola sp. S0819]KAB7624368.1 peptidoglycan-binding protein [Alkalilimnicola sp. S0819]MPQ16194.1 hypothetical protein [Alkalilimnicola sp. S0819]
MTYGPRHAHALALALLFAGPAAAVDELDILRNMYAKGYIDDPPPANLPGATSIGVDPLAVEMRLAYLEGQDRARQLALDRRMDQQRAERDRIAEMELQRRQGEQDAQRRARLDEERRLERERRAMSEPGAVGREGFDERSFAGDATGKQVVVWSNNPAQDPRTEQPNVVAVVPPVAESALRDMQQDLSAAGYDVQVNGRWDAQTHQALSRFQQSQGLASEGLMEPRTLARLDAAGTQRQRAQAAEEEPPRG